MVPRRVLNASGYAALTIGLIMLAVSTSTVFTMRNRPDEQSLEVISTFPGPLDNYVLQLLLMGMLLLGLGCLLLLSRCEKTCRNR